MGFFNGLHKSTAAPYRSEFRVLHNIPWSQSRTSSLLRDVSCPCRSELVREDRRTVPLQAELRLSHLLAAQILLIASTECDHTLGSELDDTGSQ